jgi:hypothetical protein
LIACSAGLEQTINLIDAESSLIISSERQILATPATLLLKALTGINSLVA